VTDPYMNRGYDPFPQLVTQALQSYETNHDASSGYNVIRYVLRGLIEAKMPTVTVLSEESSSTDLHAALGLAKSCLLQYKVQ